MYKIEEIKKKKTKVGKTCPHCGRVHKDRGYNKACSRCWISATKYS